MAALFKTPNLRLTRIPKPNPVKSASHYSFTSKVAPLPPPPTPASPIEPFMPGYMPKPEENMVLSSGTESGFYSETDAEPHPPPAPPAPAKITTRSQVKTKRPLPTSKTPSPVTHDLPQVTQKISKLKLKTQETQKSTLVARKPSPLPSPRSPVPPPARSSLAPGVTTRVTRSTVARTQNLPQIRPAHLAIPTLEASGVGNGAKSSKVEEHSSAKSPKVEPPKVVVTKTGKSTTTRSRTKPVSAEDEWRLGVQKREAEYQKRLKEKDDELDELRRNYANEIETYKANLSEREAEWQRLKEQYEVQIRNLYDEHTERYQAWEDNVKFLTLQCSAFRKEVDDARQSQVQERKLWQEELAQKEALWEGRQSELTQRLEEGETLKNAIQGLLEFERSERLKENEEFEERVCAAVEERTQAFQNDFLKLQQEVTSHQSVLELKNSEIRQLRAQVLADEEIKRDLHRYKDLAGTLQKRTEDLEARLQAKVEENQSLRQHDRQLRDWCRQVSQDKKRLSMEVEQLQWKLGVAAENTTSEPSSLSVVNQTEESSEEVREKSEELLDVGMGVVPDDAFDPPHSPVMSSQVVAKNDSLAWTVQFDDEFDEPREALLNGIRASLSSTPKLERRSRNGMFRSLREKRITAKPVSKRMGTSVTNGV